MNSDIPADKVWTRKLAAYRGASSARGVFELVLTLALFVAAWGAMAWSLTVGYWLTLLLSLVAGSLLVRLFALQHDCGHQALFASAKTNDWVGRALGVLTFTPYDDWRRAHALHHAGSGNLDRRGIGDIDTLTVREYRALPAYRRAIYRAYRNPLTLFVIAPAWQFILRHRWPTCELKTAMPIWSTMSTNAGILLYAAVLIWAFGWKVALAVQLPITLVAAFIGIWLFYVQHQFDETHWDEGSDWKREDAALHGSSFYDLPQPLMWLYGNIGIHHVHHISSGIPFHVLPRVLKDHPELRDIGRLTVWESLKCIPLTLWDEEERRLISFRQARRQAVLA